MKKVSFVIVMCILLFLCGCKADITQEKAEVTPYVTVEDISYEKVPFEIKGIGLSSPQQIATWEDMLYICDLGNSRVIVCDLQGNAVNEIGQIGLIEPTCIAVSDFGLCVYDRRGSKLHVLTLDGEPVREYDLSEKFNHITEIINVEIIENGTVYFSLLSLSKHIGDSGVYMIKDDRIVKISDLTVGCLTEHENNIYFMSKYELDDDKNWISGYAELLKISDEKYERVSAFSNAYSAVGIECFDDRIYAYNDCRQCLDAFSLDGEYIATLFSEPVQNNFLYKGFCMDKNGNFYLSDSKGNAIYRLEKK